MLRGATALRQTCVLSGKAAASLIPLSGRESRKPRAHCISHLTFRFLFAKTMYGKRVDATRVDSAREKTRFGVSVPGWKGGKEGPHATARTGGGFSGGLHQPARLLTQCRGDRGIPGSFLPG